MIAGMRTTEVGDWPWRLRGCCWLGAFLLGALASWYGYGADARRGLPEMLQQEQQLRVSYQEKIRATAALDFHARQMPMLEEQLSARTRHLAMPGDDHLFSVLAQAARSSGVELRHVAVEERVSEGVYTALPLRIAVAGEYANLAAFAAELARLPQLLAPREFQLGRDAESLLLQLLARAYFLPGEGAAEGVASSAGALVQDAD